MARTAKLSATVEHFVIPKYFAFFLPFRNVREITRNMHTFSGIDYRSRNALILKKQNLLIKSCKKSTFELGLPFCFFI